MIQAKGITKRFRGKTVLSDLDFELQPGVVTVLLGRNGAGKSTFLRLALGVLKADAGTLRVGGHDPVRKPRAVREAVGYVPDRPDVYEWMTPRDLYRFLKPQYPTWNDDKAVRAATALGVPLTTPFSGLSRGEGMKAMLVAALAHQPPLLLLDEPFAGLDPVVREEVLRGVIGELRSDEHTVLCATHDLDVAARIADRVAVLNEGRIAVHGTLEEVLDIDEEAARVPERMRVLLAGMTA
jgi:ABC-2 type transport system ATP-binding protein